MFGAERARPGWGVFEHAQPSNSAPGPRSDIHGTYMLSGIRKKNVKIIPKLLRSFLGQVKGRVGQIWTSRFSRNLHITRELEDLQRRG